ncbi:MAG: hypothetical protein PVJ04_12375 [Gemmatimonadota bacterium]
MSRSAISRGDLKYLMLEGLVVVFGVLAALVVDGWREEAARRSAAESAFRRVIAEVSLNLQELEDLSATVAERLERLRSLKTDAPPGVPLSELINRFTGYRTPDLREAAWDRLSGSDLSDLVDQDLLNEAFYLYEWGRQFDGLDLEIYRLTYSELFYLPERRSTAILISERIMEQQLSWTRELIPVYRDFLSSTQ